MDQLSNDVTTLLDRWSDGDQQALEALLPLVLDDVRELARQFLAKERPGHTLQPTALVNEVYLRLEKRRTVTWKNRRQFFGFLAQLIRRILVDHARTQHRAKRGGKERPLSLDDFFSLGEIRHPELVALDDAPPAFTTSVRSSPASTIPRSPGCSTAAPPRKVCPIW